MENRLQWKEVPAKHAKTTSLTTCQQM